jgi:hypothetical protein
VQISSNTRTEVNNTVMFINVAGGRSTNIIQMD